MHEFMVLLVVVGMKETKLIPKSLLRHLISETEQ